MRPLGILPAKGDTSHHELPLMLPGARRPCVGGMGRSPEDAGAAFEPFDPDDPVAVIQKPFDMAEFLETIRRALAPAAA